MLEDIGPQQRELTSWLRGAYHLWRERWLRPDAARETLCNNQGSPNPLAEVVVEMMSALRQVVAELCQLTEERQQRKAAEDNEDERPESSLPPPRGPLRQLQDLFSKPGELLWIQPVSAL